MKNFCLKKETKEEILKAVESGEINGETLSEMTRKEREDFLSKYVGKENAAAFNEKLENGILLKGLKDNYISWVGSEEREPETRRVLIRKIEEIDTFLEPKQKKEMTEELVKISLGLYIREKEAKEVFDMTSRLRAVGDRRNEKGEFVKEEDENEYKEIEEEISTYMKNKKIEIEEEI